MKEKISKKTINNHESCNSLTTGTTPTTHLNKVRMVVAATETILQTQATSLRKKKVVAAKQMPDSLQCNYPHSSMLIVETNIKFVNQNHQNNYNIPGQTKKQNNKTNQIAAIIK